MSFKPSLELTVSNILSQISEYDIFRTYCLNFQELDKPFLSELYNDTKPSCRIKQLVNGSLLYTDFGNGESYKCFEYVKAKFGVNFNNALNIINKDFKLGLIPTWTSNSYIKSQIKKEEIIINKNPVKISKKRRDWEQRDIDYWMQYDITLNTLNYFEVEPLEYFWVNYNRFKPQLITYSYEFNDGFRDIYSPLDLDRKWPCSNTQWNLHIYGLKQLPEIGDLLFIVSSLKEVMFLFELGINAIAPQSESTFIPENILKNLHSRFKEIIILFDFDKSGIIHALKHSIKYNLKRLKFCPIMISHYQGKDLTDCYVKNKNKILKLLNEYEQYS